MASTDKTNKGLNKWAGEDKPTRSDFNGDNEKMTALLEELDSRMKSFDTRLDELNAELATKANIDGQLEWKKVEFEGTYTPLYNSSTHHYAKDSSNTVYIHVSFKNTSGVSSRDTLFTLPEGYRPQVNISAPIIQSWAYSAVWSSYAIISTDGLVRLTATLPPSFAKNDDGVCLMAIYKAA